MKLCFMKDLSKQRLFYTKCHIKNLADLKSKKWEGIYAKNLHTNGALLVSMVTNINEYLFGKWTVSEM